MSIVESPTPTSRVFCFRREAGGRLPEVFGLTGAMVLVTRDHEEKVGEPVQVPQQNRVVFDASPQRDDASFRAAADRPGQVEARTDGASSRENERAKRRQIHFPPVDFVFEDDDPLFAENDLVFPRSDRVLRVAEAGRKRKQVALNVLQQRRERVGRREFTLDQTERRLKFVDVSVGGDPRVVLVDARAVDCLLYTSPSPRDS